MREDRKISIWSVMVLLIGILCAVVGVALDADSHAFQALIESVQKTQEQLYARQLKTEGDIIDLKKTVDQLTFIANNLVQTVHDHLIDLGRK